MTTYTKPHIANLKARAKALGLIITKATTAQDAYDIGHHQYVLHAPEQDWEHMEMLALGGIRYQIEQAEAAKAAADKADKEATKAYTTDTIRAAAFAFAERMACDVVACYAMAGDGIQAPGAIVTLIRQPLQRPFRANPYSVHFVNAQDGGAYYGVYDLNQGQASQEHDRKVSRFDPSGRLMLALLGQDIATEQA